MDETNLSKYKSKEFSKQEANLLTNEIAQLKEVFCIKIF